MTALNKNIEQILSEDGETIVYNPTAQLTRTLVDHFYDQDEVTDVTFLIREDVATSIRKSFLTESKLAEHRDTDGVTVLTGDNLESGGAIFVGDQMVSVVSVGNEIVVSEIQDTPADLTDDMDEQMENSEETKILAPGLSTVYSSLDEKFGEEFREQLQNVFEQCHRNHGEFNHAEATILVAANNDELLYDVGSWGEFTGVSSKATFSRMKNKLEEEGYIETERVPIEIGRPRLRLRLSDELTIDEIEEIVVPQQTA